MSSPLNPGEILTISETAALLRRDRRTLRLWRDAGTGPPYVCIGRRTAYLRADVEAWILSGRVEPSQRRAPPK